MLVISHKKSHSPLCYRQRLPAFTLLELTIVIAIIVIMSALVYANYQGISDRGDIISTTAKIEGHLKKAQAFAVSGKLNNGLEPHGWGVNFNRLRNNYTIFSDVNASKSYDYPVKLLIHGTEWTSGGTFTESSASSSKTVTISGASEENSAGKPTGTGNGYWHFDSSDYLSLAAHNDFNFGLENFTLDTWFRLPSLSVYRQLLSLTDSGTADNTWVLGINTSNEIIFDVEEVAGYGWLANATGIQANQWYHLAVMRDGGYIRAYLDGVQVGGSENFYSTSTLASYANRQIFIGGASAFDIDEVRITRGLARWKSEFTVPTALSTNDDELYSSYRLIPGVVFERLYENATAVSSTNVFWLTDDPLHTTYVGGVSGVTSTVRVNHGAVTAGSASDTPMSVISQPGGIIRSTGF